MSLSSVNTLKWRQSSLDTSQHWETPRTKSSQTKGMLIKAKQKWRLTSEYVLTITFCILPLFPLPSLQSQNKIEQLERAANPAAYKSHSRYGTHKRKVWAVNHPGEALPDDEVDVDDIVVFRTQEVSLNCPITKGALKEPVKKYVVYLRTRLLTFDSRHCGHVYSKAAIEELLHRAKGGRGRAKQVACPLSGNYWCFKHTDG